jgi:hypothetical protein
VRRVDGATPRRRATAPTLKPIASVMTFPAVTYATDRRR